MLNIDGVHLNAMYEVAKDELLSHGYSMAAVDAGFNGDAWALEIDQGPGTVRSIVTFTRTELEDSCPTLTAFRELLRDKLRQLRRR